MLVKRGGERIRKIAKFLRSSAEFTKCKGIWRIPSPSCAVSFALLSLVLGDPAQNSSASLPSSTGTRGCDGLCRMYSCLLQGGGDLEVPEPKLSSHETPPCLVSARAGCSQVTGVWQLFVPTLSPGTPLSLSFVISPVC